MKNWLYIWVIGAMFTMGSINGMVMSQGDRVSFGEQITCAAACLFMWPAALGMILGAK